MSWQSNRELQRIAAATICAAVLAYCSSASRQQPISPQEPHGLPQEPAVSQPKSGNPSPFASEIAEASRLYHAGKTTEAESAYQQVLEKSKQGGDSFGLAEAHLGLCTVAYRHGKYVAARSQCEEALSLFDSLHDSASGARVQEYFGNIAWQAGDNKAAKGYYDEALKRFEAAAMLKEKAEVLLGLAFVTDGYPERIKLETQALEIARQLGDRRIQAQALNGMGQWLFVQGNAQAAEEKYKEAEALLDSPDDKVLLARVLHNEGRLLRAHGKTDEAIAVYNRALKMTEETEDKQGTVQILNAMGASYGDERKPREALAIFQRALELAKDMNLPPMTDMLRANVAESHINLGEYQQAVDILEEMNRRNPDPFPYSLQYRYQMLGEAYNSLGKYDLAMAAVTRSIEETKAHKNLQLLTLPLMLRARIEEKLGQNEAALADTQEALQVIEDLRAHLVPADFMKRGFVNRNEAAFGYSVQILHNLRRPEQALEVAEQARSRAFLDLLAARGIQTGPAPQPPESASAKSPSNATAEKSSNAGSDVPSTTLTTRGEGARVQPSSKDKEVAASLPSPVSAAPPSSQEMAAITKRLDSTVLSYWVSSDATYIWVLKGDGKISEARTEVSKERLTKLVATTTGPRSEPAGEGAAQPEQASAPTAPVSEKRKGTIRLRGGGELVVGNSSVDAWRELYKVLILPVQDSLPSPGSRLTIVPHGPLFLLSFAALQDAQGHYFVENYALNYAPSLGVLRLTGERKQQLGRREPRYLIVADPQIAPDLSKDPGLPPLPGAREEARKLAGMLPRGETTLLLGADASKQAVRQDAVGKTVLHLATHAIVRDDQPFDSYLVLSAGDNSPPGSGRLTVQEIYGMDLQTDLVVLSACRTALGKLSGDGMVGLTRAFFYGGAPSVMATLWDVADEPTSLLISDFYKSLQKNPDKARALQSAQLQLIRELRRGNVKVKTPIGSFTLPEDPVFWAGFVLQGEL